MNWHVDSHNALKDLRTMIDLGFFEQGPYSVHFTAGPDTNTFGDNIGLDVERDPEIQKWIRLFIARGDEVGSHGGWIHNYFGKHVTDDNEKDVSQYIALNNEAISKVSGRAVREYSAPLGNHPAWVTRWLEEHGVRVHYYTGNVGQGPTRSYIDGERLGTNVWTFPVSVLGDIATFEEAALEEAVGQKEFGTWLNNLSDFAQDHALIRLVYFHPPGVVLYKEAARRWMTHTKEMLTHGKFRWYTMTRIAEFLDRRELVEWSVTQDRNSGVVFKSSHPENLSEQTWRFAKARYKKPILDTGEGTIQESSSDWIIVGGSGKLLTAHLSMLASGDNN
jgi:peptidoglycan/xylan/chitin deacetylase (PgdA/CDA1 family)